MQEHTCISSRTRPDRDLHLASAAVRLHVQTLYWVDNDAIRSYKGLLQ